MIQVIVLSPHTFSMASIIIQTKLAGAWPGQTRLLLGCWAIQPRGQHSQGKCYQKLFLCKIPKIWGRPSTTFLNYPRSGIWKIIHPCCWYHHTLYFKSYRIYQARYPVTHVTQAGKLQSPGPGTGGHLRLETQSGSQGELGPPGLPHGLARIMFHICPG